MELFQFFDTSLPLGAAQDIDRLPTRQTKKPGSLTKFAERLGELVLPENSSIMIDPLWKLCEGFVGHRLFTIQEVEGAIRAITQYLKDIDASGIGDLKGAKSFCLKFNRLLLAESIA